MDSFRIDVAAVGGESPLLAVRLAFAHNGGQVRSYAVRRLEPALSTPCLRGSRVGPRSS